jgi:hypothetical protein
VPSVFPKLIIRSIRTCSYFAPDFPKGLCFEIQIRLSVPLLRSPCINPIKQAIQGYDMCHKPPVLPS